MEMGWGYFSRSAKSHGGIMYLPGCPELQVKLLDSSSMTLEAQGGALLCWMIGFSQGARRVMAAAGTVVDAPRGKTASLDEERRRLMLAMRHGEGLRRTGKQLCMVNVDGSLAWTAFCVPRCKDGLPRTMHGWQMRHTHAHAHWCTCSVLGMRPLLCGIQT
ncbi:hypothetical protein TRV_04202 [Trichophyton verrucosum HKI 0517]|uniref:Uncharacterized protein n=1 Tax=Trichophyton verrucosum (strain HKI 0517) TaxID=663202 RepID=D4DAQ4_TRIVH|nr:uncharacterized protein TRV_04202 [Trichophyton verrucosum HKI 0517]EFE41073.1 hypothetical protein TRV_04202 [Trichophyton verrucosum HKI 0517]